MKGSRVNHSIKYLTFFVASFILIILSLVNIKNYFATKVVLGLQTENNEEVFWNNFLAKNPNYVPGLIEVGEINRANEIDPNYNIKP